MKRAFAAVVLLASCASDPARVPPAPLPEVTWAAPAPGMTWLAGQWHWDETSKGGGWVWIPGRWE